MHSFTIVFTVVTFLFSSIINAASKDKPHTHQGVLTAYDGKHIPYSLDEAQTKKLNSGESVTFHERTGKSGRGVCLQDVEASPAVTMDRIRDLANYKNMVPKVKNVEVYHEETLANGTVKEWAHFQVGLSLLTFSYYLKLAFEPTYHTLTWTLDYSRTSDFDDNIGHWQVLDHPTKAGWTRVLYSTEVKLFPWIPEFVVNFLTKTALLESTAWVRRESEKLAKKLAAEGKDMIAPPTVHLFKSCFHEVDGKASYDTDCSNNVIDAAQAAQAHVDAEVASEATDSESTGSDEVVEEGVQEEL